MRRVICVETGKVYESIVSASKETGISESMIQSCCAGMYSAAKGLHFEYDHSFEDDDSEENSIFVKRQENLWKVFCNKTLLKSFKSSACAYAYASDSAQVDARSRGLTTREAVEVQSVRHIETGKIYPSIKQASEAVGISVSGICTVLKGLKKAIKGQHFERVE